jgi:hypothetical protein
MMRCIGRVDQDGAGGELLATHGVPSAGHADRLALAAGSRERRLDSGLRMTATTRSTLVSLSFECRSLTWTPAAAARDEGGASVTPTAVPEAPRRN